MKDKAARRLPEPTLRLFWTLALVLGLLVVVTPVASAAGPAPTTSTTRFETKFMEDMIDHHSMAVMMAEMCTEKGVHPELLSACETMIADQSAEIQMMQSWLQSWYGVSYTPDMAMMTGHMKKMQMMSGAEFEMMFMQMMIRHHAGAIREAEMCLDKAYHSELEALCRNIITTQAQEIQQMQAWLCQWYDVCRERRTT